jgi:dGTP triphosphohydrolase
MRFLQNLVWRHVIDNSKLATQQQGQETIIEDLFSIYSDAIRLGTKKLLPLAFREEYDRYEKDGWSEGLRTGLAVDIVASFADSQATQLHRRLTGSVGGSVMDLVDS